jgi:hypothetical protein
MVILANLKYSENAQANTLDVERVWRAPKLLVRFKMSPSGSNNGIVWELGARSQLLALEGV